MKYEDVLAQMKQEGSPVPCARPRFMVSNSVDELKEALRVTGAITRCEFVWLPEYDRIAQWLEDTGGKGLMLYGNIGRGKSVMAKYIIPMIFRLRVNRIFTIVDCSTPTSNIDELLKRKFIVLDDVGTDLSVNNFGTKRDMVCEIVSMAHESRDVTLIVTSNLDAEQIATKYGDRILDRLKSLCYRVAFNGPSLRK